MPITGLAGATAPSASRSRQVGIFAGGIWRCAGAAGRSPGRRTRVDPAGPCARHRGLRDVRRLVSTGPAAVAWHTHHERDELCLAGSTEPDDPQRRSKRTRPAPREPSTACAASPGWLAPGCLPGSLRALSAPAHRFTCPAHPSSWRVHCCSLHWQPLCWCTCPARLQALNCLFESVRGGERVPLPVSDPEWAAGAVQPTAAAGKVQRWSACAVRTTARSARQRRRGSRRAPILQPRPGGLPTWAKYQPACLRCTRGGTGRSRGRLAL